MFSRRQILKNASAGFGYLAFAGLSTASAAQEAGSTESIDRKSTALSSASEASHLSVYAGRPVSCRFVRLQTSTDQGSR